MRFEGEFLTVILFFSAVGLMLSQLVLLPLSASGIKATNRDIKMSLTFQGIAMSMIRLNSPGTKWLLPRDAAARLDLWLGALDNALYYKCTGVLPP